MLKGPPGPPGPPGVSVMGEKGEPGFRASFSVDSPFAQTVYSRTGTADLIIIEKY